MCFTDNIVFNIETSIKSNYLYKLNKKWKATTPIEVKQALVMDFILCQGLIS